MKSRLSSLLVLASFLLGWVHFAVSQETYPSNGPRNAVHNSYVFTHANIVVGPGEVIRDADMIVRDERIVFVGRLSEIPSNAVIKDLNGYWIYPSFIELDSEYGLKKVKGKTTNSSRGRSYQPQIKSKTKGAFSWNEAIHPERNAVDVFHVNAAGAKNLRSMGFGLTLSHVHDGIMRGTSALVFTSAEEDNMSLYKGKVANHFSFAKGSSKQSYPNSMMGSIALIRQTLYDTYWYSGSEDKKELNLSLEALNENRDLPQFFAVDDYLSALRADKIANEFEIPFVICGSGDEYKRIEQIKACESSFIVPLKFPLPYDLSNSYDLADVPLGKLKHWELAPYNVRYLSEANVEFALSSKGLKKKDFWKNLRTVYRNGLSEQEILASLTTIPAKLVGCDSELGQIKQGYIANFFITTQPLFEAKSQLVSHWVNGKSYPESDFRIDIRGEYNLNVKKNGAWLLKVEGDHYAPKAKIVSGKKIIPVDLKVSDNEIQLRFLDKKGYVLLSGQVNDEDSRIWVGKAQLPNGIWSDWAAIRQTDYVQNDSSVITQDTMPLPLIQYPSLAYGLDSLPKESAILYKYATIWTNEDTGILSNADICIYEGKIKAIGVGLTKASIFGTSNIEIELVNAEDIHITSGIIDEHSHIAISRGVNEAGQASSAEVRIGDVINSDDINIYRQLAGGVTASQLLHGSANPIGGQSAMIKLRWGMDPESMKVEGADGFIKFALGENVKQSNWGDRQRVRYPQTRMGVEQVFYDHFMRATEYGEIWKIYDSGVKSKKLKKNQPIKPRRDIELDALSEILNHERFITCHSYRQSEINMLMHVADSLNFTLNTFTHILEGYKVADKMKKHGAGASTFSDWWAYKFEVNDAIPHNAAILTEQGIVTAINSDDPEMGRRLNQEAAKSVKYGGISQEEAWKMVSLNPAKLLHLDDRMGSLKEGKDADVVIWSDNPLSINAIVEKTYVDGRCYYSSEKDKELRVELNKERNRLIQKMIGATSKGKKSRKFKAEVNKEYHCDSIEENWDEDL